MLFAAKYSVRGISLTTPTNYSVDAIPQIFARNSGRQGVNYVALGYHADTETVYFSDIRNYAIMHAKINSSKRMWINFTKIISASLQYNIEGLHHILFLYQNASVLNSQQSQCLFKW